MISTVSQAIIVLLIIAYAVLLYKYRMKPRVIRICALAILAAGIVIHMYGLMLSPWKEGPVTTFLRATIMSIKMFIYDFDLVEMEEAQETSGFLDVYFLIFYLAVLTSISAIIMLFGKRAMTLFSLLFRKEKFEHVFIGLNNRSEVVASGLEGESVAFIEFPSDEKESKVSVGSILKSLNSDKKKESARGDGAMRLYAKKALKLGYEGDNVFASIGLERLKRLVDSDTAFYILSEDTDRNLNELMTLLGDRDLTRNVIHVCLSREGVARYYKTTLKQTGVHFIYPSSMAVVELMTRPDVHPSSVMRTGGKGTVEDGLNALVIGFGETGQAVTKFLYEFSSAVGADGKPVPTSITVNDDRIEYLKGPFFFDNPGLVDTSVIRYENFGTESSGFWNSLMESIDSLNYIAISMNDDAHNLDLACTIFVYAMKKRSRGLDSLKIVVRKRVTLSHEKRLIDKMNEKAGHEVIVCYGEHDKVFTTDKIVSKGRSGINRRATSLADRISEAYERVSGNRVETDTKAESFHSRNRARMELHQMISRSNHNPSLKLIAGGVTDPDSETLENLARMEHLRYSRYLSAHGYSFAPEDDDVFKSNHQICSWDNLSDEDRQYHRDMVRAQLSI